MLRSIQTIAIVAMLTAASQSSFAQGNFTRQLKGNAPPQVKKLAPNAGQFQQQALPQQVARNGGQFQTKQLDIGGGGPGQSVVLAYFSPRLGARFEIQWIQVGNFQPVLAARIVSTPVYGSPLRQLGLTIGDVITRLDGVPVRNTCELERHVYDTRVRFVKAGANHVHKGTIYINANTYFPAPSYRPAIPSCETSQCGLRP